MPTETPLDSLDQPKVPGVRHRYLPIRDTRVHVVDSGSDAAPAVLLLHGFPQHWYVWRNVISALAQDRHVIAVDLPGFGWSGPSVHGYSTSERVRCVIALLDTLGVDTADIVGHDWGAWLAFHLALDAPRRVGRLVAISEIHPWPRQRRLLPNLWRMWVTALFEVPGLSSLVQRDRRIVRWFLSRDAVNRAVWTDDLVDVYAARAADPAVARAGQRLHSAFVLRDIPRLILGRDRPRPFRTPTLLLGGSRDTYIPPALLTPPRTRDAWLRVETVEGGHFILDENPTAVIAAVRAHLGVLTNG
jgi:pimeloyl-ACP methyl ester carboxylesterase